MKFSNTKYFIFSSKVEFLIFFSSVEIFSGEKKYACFIWLNYVTMDIG